MIISCLLMLQYLKVKLCKTQLWTIYDKNAKMFFILERSAVFFILVWKLLETLPSGKHFVKPGKNVSPEIFHLNAIVENRDSSAKRLLFQNRKLPTVFHRRNEEVLDSEGANKPPLSNANLATNVRTCASWQVQLGRRTSIISNFAILRISHKFCVRHFWRWTL